VNAVRPIRRWDWKLRFLTAVCSVVLVRLDMRMSAMTSLIEALPTDSTTITQPAVKSLLHLLLSATHANDVSCSLPFSLSLSLSLCVSLCDLVLGSLCKSLWIWIPRGSKKYHVCKYRDKTDNSCCSLPFHYGNKMLNVIIVNQVSSEWPWWRGQYKMSYGTIDNIYRLSARRSWRS